MAAAPAPNHRASLLSGLRTGGVRSASGIPQTAAPGASFNVPRFSSASYNTQYQDQDEDGDLADMVSQNMYLGAAPRMPQPPNTAAVDGSNNRFSQQQSGFQGGFMAGSGLSNGAVGGAQRQAQAQQQALQMQMMQLELMRLQAVQAQQFQAELIAQAQRQQNGRSFNPPATAGPMNASFDLRSATLNSQMRRSAQGDALRTGIAGDDQVPMTAALGGKFGSRATLSGSAEDDYGRGNFQPPPTPSYTTVISGGTPLGASGNNGGSNVAPSKSDSAVSWRRGANSNSVLGANRTASLGATPNVKITPPPLERVSPPPSENNGTSPVRTRPQPLRFIPASSQPLPIVSIDEGSDGEDNSSETSSKSGGSHSSPTTPHSGSSFDRPPLSPREEATKKLYEGLGIGRPIPNATPAAPAPAGQPQRVLSQPVRQPRGPPSGADELGPRNFATRIRRKAIGGLGVLMDARERRDVVEAY